MCILAVYFCSVRQDDETCVIESMEVGYLRDRAKPTISLAEDMHGPEQSSIAYLFHVSNGKHDLWKRLTEEPRREYIFVRVAHLQGNNPLASALSARNLCLMMRRDVLDSVTTALALEWCRIAC